MSDREAAAAESQAALPDSPVPASVIPPGRFPPLRYRDMPPAVPIRQMIGPSVMLAGLALGSGEFIFWPKLTYQSGFGFFWACLVGVVTQYFMNMEIARWTLVTGESAVTGFCRINRHLAWVFLGLHIIPWLIPAWAQGSAQLISWLCFSATLDPATGLVHSPYVLALAIGGLFLCGIVLTAGPVIYETVEKAQLFLVSFILVAVVVLACFVVRSDAVTAQWQSVFRLERPELGGDVNEMALLGAIAFAGVGGTLNLGQSNYVKEKGYGMGRYIGRITSLVTGKEEPAVEFGYHFPHTTENLSRWRHWWRAAGIEHFFSFLMTCVVCLTLLTLLSYSLFYDSTGQRAPDHGQYAKDLNFVWGEAILLQQRLGSWAYYLFLGMGVAILLTTELGVLDASSRISMDLVKVNWLRDNPRWSESRIYYVFLWGTILLGSGLLLVGPEKVSQGFFLFKLTASLNGAVMFLYCLVLIYLNCRVLPAAVRITWPRLLMMIWAVLFFGYFTVLTVWTELSHWWSG